MSRNAARLAMVVVPGVATSSRAKGRLVVSRRAGDPGDLAVGRVAACLAQHEDVLAGRVEDHELVRLAATHDPDVARNGDRLEPQPLEGARIRLVLRLIAHVEPGRVPVAAVGVLHHELAHPDQPGAGAGLVPPLGLEVVDHHRQLAVRPHDLGQQDPDDLLVGHREHHVPPVAVLEPGQLGPDRVVAAARPPDVGGVDDRHLHLLAADPVLLLANDLLHAVVDALAQRQQRVDPGAQGTNVARPEQQPVRRHLDVGGIVAQRGEEQVGKAHGAKDTGDAQAAAINASSTPPATTLATWPAAFAPIACISGKFSKSSSWATR